MNVLKRWLDVPAHSQFLPNEWEARFLGAVLAGVVLGLTIVRLGDLVAGWVAR